MGTGWRRAFCSTGKNDPDTSTSTLSEIPSTSPSLRSCAKLGFFPGGSNPNTPRLHSNSNNQTPTLRCRTNTTSEQHHEAATLSFNKELRQCKSTNSTPKSTKSPRSLFGSSNPSSPLKLSLFRNSFRFKSSSCGLCLNGVKTGQGTAIYTAECGHAFHFPCICSHVRKQGSTILVCPVCNSTWKDVPLLSPHKNDAPEDKPLEESTPNPIIIKKPNLRSYDDDEPLVSPTTGARFNPIPEADEEKEEDLDVEEEEFQGFFVTPAPKSDDVQRNVQVRVMPQSAIISSSSRGYQTYAVSLTLKAPTLIYNKTTSHRAPIDLVTVLDVSGSMTGSKLQMLKRAMQLVISSLGSSDRLSIVAFSSYTKRLLPLSRMTSLGQRAARRIVDRLVCFEGGSSVVGEALRKATKVLEDRRERNPVASIMLLSDGHDDNFSNQRSKSSRVSSTRFSHIEIPVHSFGFGRSNGFTHQSGVDSFAKCVGGILSVVVQDLRIQLGFPFGSAPAEILAVYSCNNGRPICLGSGSVRVGDLYAEEERELLVEMRSPVGGSHTHHVMSVRCLYKDPATKEVVYGRDQNVLVPQAHGLRSDSEPKMERLRSLFVSTRAVAEARRLVERSDFTSAVDLLVSSRDLLVKWGIGGGGVSEEFVKVLEAELAEVHWWRQQYEKQQMMMMIQRRKVDGERDHQMVLTDENGEPLTPTSAWRAAERLAKVAMLKKSLNRVSDLHGFENARF